MHFTDRRDAGRQLAQALEKYKNQAVVVYGLPRGGVVLAEEIAKFLGAPLDLILAHKIGHPLQPEYAIAAVSEGGHLVGNTYEIESVDRQWFEREKERQVQEIKRRRMKYLKGRKEPPVEGRAAILVDDGIATGLTMQAAVLELEDRNPEKIIVAVPVSPGSTAELFRSKVDDFVGLEVPDDYHFLGAIGAYYREFPQIEDEEVIEILENHAKNQPAKRR